MQEATPAIPTAPFKKQSWLQRLLRAKPSPLLWLCIGLALIVYKPLLADSYQSIAGFGKRPQYSLGMDSTLRNDWHTHVPITMMAVRSPTGWVVYDEDTKSWDELSAIIAERPSDVVRVMIAASFARTGMFMPTMESRSIGIELVRLTSVPLDPSDARAIRTLVLDEWSWIQAIPPAYRTILATQNIDEHSTLWVGYLLNVGAVILAITWLYTWKWIPDHLRRERMYHHAQWIARGLCPRCRYDIRGQQHAGITTCPECGLDLTPPPRSA